MKYLTSNKFIKKHIKVYKNKKNMGAGFCSRLAVKKSKGEYFMRVDSDDFINRNTIDIMHNIMRFNEKIGYIYCDHFRTDEFGLKQEIVKLNTINKVYLHGAGILFKKKFILKVGNYNSKFREAEDHDLLKRLNKVCKSFYLPIPLYDIIYMDQIFQSKVIEKIYKVDKMKKNYFKIGKVNVANNKCIIIAEAGVNHNGNMKLAERLIKEAKNNGADIIKFQTYKAENLTIKKSPRFWNWEGEKIKNGSQYDSYKSLDSFNEKDYLKLSKLCKKYNIEFMSTPFDHDSVDMLTKIGVKGFKVASCDISNFPLLKKIALRNYQFYFHWRIKP